MNNYNQVTKIIERMGNLPEYDCEASHRIADELLCDMIRELCKNHAKRDEIMQMIARYDGICRWYS